MRDDVHRQDGGSTAAGVAIGVLLTLLVGVGADAMGLVNLLPPEAEAVAPPPPSEPEPHPDPVTTAAPPAPPSDTAEFVDVYADVSSGVVRLENTRCSGELGGTGSGALLSPDLVVTAAHVVSGHSSVQLLLGDQSATGEVIGFDPTADLALVRASRPLTGHVFELSAEPAGIGSEVAAIGYPLSGPLSMAGPGFVSTYGEAASYQEWDGSVVDVSGLMRTTVPTNAGNSGGPLVDLTGAIVGLISGTRLSQGTVDQEGGVLVDVVEGFKYAVPASRISDRADRWLDVPEPLAPRDCAAPSEPAPLALVTAQTEGPDTDDVVAVLFDYFDGINRSDYERAYRQLAADRQETLSLDRFIAEQETSYISGVVVLETMRVGDELTAVVTFTTYQDPAYGPDGLDCAYWLLDYQFVAGGEHGWSIAGSSEVPGQPRFEGCS